MASTFTAPKNGKPIDTQQKALTGTVSSVRVPRRENGWCVLSVRCDGETVCCVGSIVDSVPEGKTYDFEGEWKQDPRYGWQFSFNAATPVRPKDAPGIRKYLASGIARGIGEAVANSIVDFFGDRTIEVLDALDAEMLMQVPGVGKAKAESIVEAWSAAEKNRGITVELLGKGLTSGMCVKIIRYFDEQGIDPLVGLKEDPYALTAIWGIGFKLADSVALKLGMSIFDPRRLKAGVIYALQQGRDSQGHVYLRRGELVAETAKLCSVGADKIDAFLDGKPIDEVLGTMDDDDDDLL